MTEKTGEGRPGADLAVHLCSEQGQHHHLAKAAPRAKKGWGWGWGVQATPTWPALPALHLCCLRASAVIPLCDAATSSPVSIAPILLPEHGIGEEVANERKQKTSTCKCLPSSQKGPAGIPPYPLAAATSPNALDSALKRLTRAPNPEVKWETEKNLNS